MVPTINTKDMSTRIGVCRDPFSTAAHKVSVFDRTNENVFIIIIIIIDKNKNKNM